MDKGQRSEVLATKLNWHKKNVRFCDKRKIFLLACRLLRAMREDLATGVSKPAEGWAVGGSCS